MYGAQGEVLYVGKAKNLKNRLSSYFVKTITNPKTYSLVKHICDIQVTITHTENEALILENTLIKKYKPRYNVLFRDDKSFPYLYLSTLDEFPRLNLYRGIKNKPGRYFGPYPNASSAHETLHLLQKLFHIRQCDDTFFKNRSRPCLQYQIKRCSAPCVRFIEPTAYAQDIRHAQMFLEGKNTHIISELANQMHQAADDKEYEKAAVLRDRISSLRRIQEKQYVSGEAGDVDIVVLVCEHAIVCVELLFIRAGRLVGNRAFFPNSMPHTETNEILCEFLSHHYIHSGKNFFPPDEIIVSEPSEELEWFSQTLKEQSGKNVKITSNPKGNKAHWVAMAITNGKQAIHAKIQTKANIEERLTALQDALNLTELPSRIECFDVSHTMGESTVASCVVFDRAGPLKKDYRHFNIQNVAKGDDYAALRQAVLRRYTRIQKSEGKLPDVLIIDGGKGQLHQALSVLEELQITEIKVLGIAKGISRKPGLEVLHIAGANKPIALPSDSLALHFIQHIRDEAHRFAIAGHRHSAAKKRTASALETIPGIGSKRKRDLLAHFGGWQEIKMASVEELSKVNGISVNLAQKLFSALHEE